MRERSLTRGVPWVLGVCLLLAGSRAYAGAQDISGKKFLLKTSPSGKEKMVLLSKDVLVNPGAMGSSADPRCIVDGGSGWGGAVALDDGTNTATLSMTCRNSAGNVSWTSNGAGTLYKFKNPNTTPHPMPKVAKVKAGLLKVVSLELGGFPVPNGSKTVNVKMRVGLDKYCMAFTGTGDGRKFLVKDAPTSTSCPATPGCTGEFVGGACWFVGESGESCDDTCASMGKICDPATVSYAGTGGTLSGCTAVVSAIFVNANPANDNPFVVPGVGCIVFPGAEEGPVAERYTDSPTTCSASGGHRICACM